MELESVQPSSIENEELWELFISRLLKHKNVRKLELYGVMPPLKLSTLVDTSRVDLALRTIFLNTLFLSAQQLMRFVKILEMNVLLNEVKLKLIESDATGGLSQLMLLFGESTIHSLQIDEQELSALEIFCLGQAIKARNTVDGQKPRRFKLAVDFELRDSSNLGTSALRMCLAAIVKSAKHCDFLNVVNCFNGMNKEIEKAYFLQLLREVGLLVKNR